MKLYLIFIFSIFFLFFISCSKTKTDSSDINNNDSISFYFKKYKDSKDNNERKIFLNKSLSGININTDASKIAELTFELYNLNRIQDFNLYSKLLLKKSLLQKDSINLGKAYRCRGIYFDNAQVLDSSYYYFIKAEKLYFKIKDKKNLATVQLNKGILQYSLSDFLGSELSLNKALKYFKDIKDYNKLYLTLNQLGLVSNELKEYDKAIFYHKLALENLKNIDEQQLFYEKGMSYNNIGFLYLKQEKYTEAESYFNLALKNKSIKKDEPLLYANLVDNLAVCKLRTKNFKNTKELFFEALSIRLNFNNTNAIIGSYVHLSEYYTSIGNLDEALKYSKFALNKAKESKIPANILVALKQASFVDKTNFYNYSEEYVKLSDSINILERKSKDRLAKIAFETDEIIQEKDQLEDKNRNLLYFFFGSVGLFGFLYYLRTQRAKNRELIYKQAQQRANEEIFNLMMSQQAIIDESRTQEKQKLARDLHDGVLGRMFGLRLSLDSVNRKNDEASLLKRLQIIDELKTIEQDIREISHDLNREKQVLINNFVSIVNNLIEEQKEKHNAKVSFFLDTSIHWDKIASAVKINLYRILQESLQNINKYANAKNINIGFVKNEDTIIFKISDDGIGFDANKKTKGIGTQNMVARTKECKGTIDIQSEIGEGTTITITIPTENK